MSLLRAGMVLRFARDAWLMVERTRRATNSYLSPPPPRPSEEISRNLVGLRSAIIPNWWCYTRMFNHLFSFTEDFHLVCGCVTVSTLHCLRAKSPRTGDPIQPNVRTKSRSRISSITHEHLWACAATMPTFWKTFVTSSFEKKSSILIFLSWRRCLIPVAHNRLNTIHLFLVTSLVIFFRSRWRWSFTPLCLPYAGAFARSGAVAAPARHTHSHDLLISGKRLTPPRQRRTLWRFIGGDSRAMTVLPGTSPRFLLWSRMNSVYIAFPSTTYSSILHWHIIAVLLFLPSELQKYFQ